MYATLEASIQRNEKEKKEVRVKNCGSVGG